MTDHFIRRSPPSGDLQAEMPETPEFFANPYRGEVLPYYPPAPAQAGLYQAVAQVTQRNNPPGIARLTSELARLKPAEAQFYIELGQALLLAANPAAAVAQFEQAAKIKPNSHSVALNLGDALTESGQAARAVVVLTHAVQAAPADALL
jgi:Flp pilus assembly protein TadD